MSIYMKKLILGFMGCFVLTLTSVQTLQAQIGDKFVPHMGFFYEIINFRDESTSGRDISANFYTFTIGTYYTLLHKNDVVSLGVDPSINLGFNPFRSGNETGLSFLIQAPVFLMGRLGANSTSYNEQKFGIGAGIGGVYSFYREGITKRNAGFLNPSAVVEGTILSGGGTLTLRAHISLFDPEITLSSDSSPNLTFRSTNVLGIGLIYGF